MKYLIYFVLCFLSVNTLADTKLVTCGKEWINIHKYHHDLIGIYVQWFPDSVLEEKVYKGKHPAMLIFLFKNNHAHTVTYTPSGQVQNGVWWEVPEDHWIRKVVSHDLKPDVECAYWKK